MFIVGNGGNSLREMMGLFMNFPDFVAINNPGVKFNVTIRRSGNPAKFRTIH